MPVHTDNRFNKTIHPNNLVTAVTIKSKFWILVRPSKRRFIDKYIHYSIQIHCNCTILLEWCKHLKLMDNNNNNASIFILWRLHQNDNDWVTAILWPEAHYRVKCESKTEFVKNFYVTVIQRIGVIKTSGVPTCHLRAIIGCHWIFTIMHFYNVAICSYDKGCLCITGSPFSTCIKI